MNSGTDPALYKIKSEGKELGNVSNHAVLRFIIDVRYLVLVETTVCFISHASSSIIRSYYYVIT